MRRIPRPQRAIDPSLPISSLLRHQVPPPSCLRAASPYPHLRTTSASFSTTPAFSFLLSGKQDKKKHQQFVRRWQKRLLGDSEPIGAHVDPYDPTSPVRIAPEEQGEEVEVLEGNHTDPGMELEALYEEALDVKTRRPGKRLRHVGGKRWTEQLEEGNLAKEFEKLTMRTYTPLSVQMADQIEDLTGTPYTLRDENLMMAQTFHDFTGKPYTEWGFGRRTPIRDPKALRENFHRAVVEIYALKQAGKDLNLSASANRGIYNAPEWLEDVKLQKTSNSDVTLVFPGEHTLETLVEEIQRVPEYSPEQEQPLEGELLVEEGEDTTVAQPEQPTMDPDTPPAKRAALVKQDPDKKPFDFMSNRPLPRAKPVESTAEPMKKSPETATPEPEAAPKPATPALSARLEAAAERLELRTAKLRNVALESAAQHAEQDVAIARKAIRDSLTAMASKSTTHVPAPEVEAKWRHMPLTDSAIKFALTKRLNQLTGLYISDPQLTSADSLGDLYHHFCAAAKPEPKHLHTFLNVEGGRQNSKANKLAQHKKTPTSPSPQRPHVGTLLKLGNVSIHRSRPGPIQERRKIGLQKVVRTELADRDLIDKPQLTAEQRREEREERNLRKRETRLIEGTRVAPEFGVPVSPNAAETLKKRTLRKRKELEEQISPVVVDRIIRESNLPQGQRVMV